MTPRNASARRTKRSAGAAVGRFWILIVAIAIVLVAGAGFAEFWPGFYPKQIVVTGNARIDRATILHAAAIARHRSIWLQSIRSMASRIAALPFVGRATVHRYPPATIAIRISERVPFAIVRRGEDDAMVDDTLRVLQVAPEPGSLPVFMLSGHAAFVAGTFLRAGDAVALRTVYASLQAAELTPKLLAFDRYGQVEATTRNGMRLLLGEPNDLESKVRLCSAILLQTAALRRKPAIVDVRAPSTPVVTYATRG